MMTIHKPFFINRIYYPYIGCYSLNFIRVTIKKAPSFKHKFNTKKTLNYPIKNRWSTKTKLKFYYS